MKEVVFTVLDVETTGLSPSRGGRVCEIAMLQCRGGEEVGAFESLVHPGRPIPPEVTRIHGIDDAAVASSPRFEEIAGEVAARAEGTVLVCHNAPFDVGFVAFELERAGLRLPPVPVVDTLALARRHFRFPRNNMGVIAECLGIEQERWHRAMSDVRTTEAILRRFLNAFAAVGVDTLGGLLELHR